MSDTRHTKVLIIGSGPAGYTAGIYAARALLSPILIEGIEPGGQLTITTEVENWPGETSIQGPELMQKMGEHARAMGCETVSDHISTLDLKSRPFKAVGETGTEYTADAVILATGAQAKWLGLESESFFKGFGVSACATCDGFFYRNKEVVVVGGGNTAVEEALFLTTFASKVTLVHRRDELRAEKILQERLLNHPKIEVIWDHVVDAIEGDIDPKSVKAVKLKHRETGEVTELPCDGVFIAIGHAPSSQLVKDQLDTENGYVLTEKGTTKTSIEGVFAAGDLVDPIYRQAITSAGMGCQAALDVERYLSHKNG